MSDNGCNNVGAWSAALQDMNVDFKPNFPRSTIPEVVERLYGLKVTDIKELLSYDDLNFHLHVGDTWNNANIEAVHEHGYVLKVLNSFHSSQPFFTDAEHALRKHVGIRGIPTQIPIVDKEGKLWSLEKFTDSDSGKQYGPYAVRLLTYIQGATFVNTPYVSGSYYNIGKFVGKFRQAIQDFRHCFYDDRVYLWSITELSSVKEFLSAVKNKHDSNVVRAVLAAYEKQVVPRYPYFTKGVIHGDINDHNLVMMEIPNQSSLPLDQRVHDVIGLLDFTDVTKSYDVFDIAICIAYMSIECPDKSQLDVGGHVLAGYLKVWHINEVEFQSLKVLVCARLCQTLVYGAHSSNKHPENTYLLVTSKRGWPLLHKLWSIDEDVLLSRWRAIIKEYDKQPTL